MTSQKIFNDNMVKGFSLIEVIIVIAIVAVVASFGTVFSMSSISRSTALSERDLLVALLTQTRAKALANIDEKAHSLYVDKAHNTYVMYEGTTYSSGNNTNIVVPKVSPTLVTGLETITFQQLTADVTNAGTITVGTSSQTYTIEINNTGRINW